MGIGLATYVEVTGPGGGAEFGSTELLPDGRFRVVTGSTPYGQGHVTTWAMLAADRLGVPMDRIEVIHGDTDLVPSGGVTGGSRSVQMAGSAVADASEKLVAAATEVAADLLEASAGDVVFDAERGEFHVVGTPSVSVGWEPIATARADDPLETFSDLTQDGSTFPFGTHIAVVEIDPELGKVELVRFVAVDDAGTIINPLLAHGQVHGGIAQGVAQALLEEVLFDADGNPLTSTFADYGIISSAELPSFEVLTMETPTPLNPLGAKGIGESGTIGATPAVQNAVVDALSHLGVRHVDIPCTAQRVWAAIRDAGSTRAALVGHAPGSGGAGLRSGGGGGLQHEDADLAVLHPGAVLGVAAVDALRRGPHRGPLVVGGGPGHRVDGAALVGHGRPGVGLEVEHPGRRARASEVGAEQGEVVADRHRDQRRGAGLPAPRARWWSP